METITISKIEYNRLIQLTSRLSELELLVISLQDELKLLKNSRNSSLSSSAPSSDLGRSNSKSLREKSGLRSGGQKGHKGSTLKMKAIADEFIEYKVDICPSCGTKLSETEQILATCKQEIEIPPIVPKYVEHRSFSCTCKNCGEKIKSKLPERLKGNIQYHPNISGFANYFSNRQYIPYNRVTETFRDVFNLPISEGTIENMLISMKKKCIPTYQEIKNEIEIATVVGGDETGLKIDKKKGWLFVFQNEVLTFLSVSMSRGFNTIENLFKDGFPHAVYNSDCWAPQLKTPAKAHQLCTAHLLRELKNFIETFDCKWSLELKLLLQSALKLKKELTFEDYENILTNEKVKEIEAKLDNILSINLDGKHKKLIAFKNRLNKNRNSILTFLYFQNVPPDNNGSERAIRNGKVKIKISGQFKTLLGAECYTVVRSIIDTAIKNTINPFQKLLEIANLPAG